MVTPGYRLILLLPVSGGPAFPCSPFRLGVPYQSRVDTPHPEVHLPRYPGLDLLGLTDAQRLRKKNLGKDKRSLGVPTPAKNPLPFRSQDLSEAAPY